MPCLHLGKQYGILSIAGTYRRGDPPPSGYLDWHEWAWVQAKAGLRQTQCARCGLWRFPQEMSGLTGKLRSRPVCTSCAEGKGVR